jgi:hypothetical protein
VLATIHELIGDLSVTPVIDHVKGHQDDKLSYDELSLPAQLNVDADALATDELLNYPTPCEHVPLLPAAHVQLNIAGRTITRKLGPAIRRQHGLRLLKEYMNERFHWDNEMIESVNWESFSKAFRSNQKLRAFTFKLCFWLLPTGATLHRRSTRFDPRCPACGHHAETDDHMFQCKATSRRRWQSSLLSSIRKRAEASHTDPRLVHLLLAGLRSYFDDSPMPIVEFVSYPTAHKTLLKNQTSLGWGHLLRGRWSLLWKDIQQDYMYRHHTDKKFDSDVWHRKLLNPLLSECHALWTLRNGERHGTEKSIQRQKRLEQLERDLIDLYKYEHDVLASDRDLFDRPIADLLTMPLNEISKWIISRKPIILFSRREANRLNVSHVRLLPKYFHPLQNRPRKRKPRRSARPASPAPSSTVTPMISAHFVRLPSAPVRRRLRPSVQSSKRPLIQIPIEFPDNPT